MVKIKTTTTSLCYAAASVVVGLVARSKLAQQPLGPIVETCTSIDYKDMADFVDRTGYQPYDRRFGCILGDALVCIVTQQLYSSTTTNYILTALKLLLQLPVMTITVIEAGRQGNQGLLLWPTLLSLLYYCLGTSVIFPSLWVASYCLVGNNNNHYNNLEGGATELKRGPAALLIALPSVLLFAMASHLSWAPGLLGSPLLALLPLTCWSLKAPEDEVSSKDAIVSAKTIATTYAVMGMVSFLGWMGMIYTFVANYYYPSATSDNEENDSSSSPWLLFWNDANPSLLIEIGALAMGWMLFLASRSTLSALEALLLTPFVGPSAAIAGELAALELEKYTIPMPQQQAAAAASSNHHNNNNNTTKRKKKKKH